MPETVYALCFLTSLACAALLARGYARSRTRLLLWSALCFGAIALNNALLLLDHTLVPHLDLTLWRSAFALAGVSVLVYGLVWDAQ